MTRSKRMQPVADVAVRREREAAARLGECQQREQACVQRLEELQRYRDEYTRRFADGGSLSAARLCDYRTFLERLNQAIEQQGDLLARARRDCEAQRRRWLDLHGRAEALGKVVSRYRGEERAGQERREQQELDQRTQSTRRPDGET
jgi:flagellar FliJ protein